MLLYAQPFKNGSQAALPYPSLGRTRDVYAISFTFSGQFQRLRCIVPNDSFALAANMETWSDHLSVRTLKGQPHQDLAVLENPVNVLV